MDTDARVQHVLPPGPPDLAGPAHPLPPPVARERAHGAGPALIVVLLQHAPHSLHPPDNPLLLLRANATLTVCHSHSQNLPALTRQADVLVNTEMRSVREVAQQVIHQFHMAQSAHR